MGYLQVGLEYLFRQSAPVQLGAFVVHGLVIYGLSLAFIRFFSRRANPSQWTPVGPYFASISVLFALFLAFHGAGIWANKAHAERAFVEAGTAIKRLDEMLSPGQLDLPRPRAALQRYVRYVFKDEWRKSRNRTASPRAEGAFRDLQARTIAVIGDLPAPVAAQVNSLLNDVARTRSDRLWVGGNHTEAVSWLAVFALGLLTHLAIASIHFDKPKAGAIALALLALTTTTAYWSLGIVDDPYRLMDHLDPSVWLPPPAT
jgi:hypothetical protein